MGYTSIFYGQRYRFQIGQAIGGYEYTEAVADYRKYFSLGFPWTFALRFSGQGRFGKDEDLFPIFIGSPDRVRGYTYGSYIDDECDQFVGSLAACSQLDQLIGSRMMVTSAEFRFPLFRGNALGFVPVGLPPVEGAIWADAGVAWSAGNKLTFNQPDPANPNFANYRAPFTSWGASVRLNLFGFAIFNLDYAMPQQRNFARKKGYWILSLQPPF
jgi:outer membrane protein assembly factor BamA